MFKLTLTVSLTLTDTVTVIFFYVNFVDYEKVYLNNTRNVCRGAVAGSVGGPFFYRFLTF